MAVTLAVLDLSPIVEGGDAARALKNSLDLARHAERWGYVRYWVAEHHNMRGIASAATAVVIGHIAGGTSSIRVGAGGVMLPNHAPLVIAEQFGTLESLYPGRIDLGLGRAPGTDQMTAHALRRTLTGNIDDFPRDVMELRDYFAEAQPDRHVQAVPGGGAEGAVVDPGFQSVWRPTRGAARLAVRIRVALRACRARSGARHLSGTLCAIGPTCRALRHGGFQCHCRRHRRRGTFPA